MLKRKTAPIADKKAHAAPGKMAGTHSIRAVPKKGKKSPSSRTVSGR